MGFFGFINKDLGIDLGTANTLVNEKNKGVIISEPSVVAYDTNTSRVLAVGQEAKAMIGRTPGNITAIRPLKDGVIADFEITHKMLKYFIEKANEQSSGFKRVRVVIGVPSEVTEVEKRAVIEASYVAGAKRTYLIEEPLAAAIGAGLPVAEARGSMVVDIGGGTSDIAVISLGGIVLSRSLRVGGDELDESIISYIRKEYNLMIGDRTAEEIKISIGNAYSKSPREEKEITGRNLLTGLPKKIKVNSDEIRGALSEPVTTILDGIKFVLERTPPELASDIAVQGIMLTGGGALLRGLDRLISDETGIPVHIAESPLNCVARGTGMALENIDKLSSVFIDSKKYGY